MVNENLEQVAAEVAEQPVDAVVEDASPDTEQDAPYTRQEVQTMLDSQKSAYAGQIAGLTSQLRGLTSKIDTGLNAVRQDTKAWAEKELGDLKSQLGRRWIEDLDEDQRKVVEPLLQEIDTLRKGQSPSQPQGTSAGPVELSPQSDDHILWPALQSVALAEGVKVNDAALYDGMHRGLTHEQLITQFRANAQAQRTAASQTPAAKVAPVETASPPVEPAPANRGGGYRKWDDVLDAYNTDKISLVEAQRLAPTFNQTL